MQKLQINKPWYICSLLEINGIKQKEGATTQLVRDATDCCYDVEVLNENGQFLKIKIFAHNGDSVIVEVLKELAEIT